MKRASCYLLAKSIVLFAKSSDIANGIWVSVPPFYKLPKVFDENLVLAIKRVLAYSKEQVLFTSDYSASSLLRESTNLTFKKLQTIGVKLVSLSQEGDSISFSPNKIIGDNKGFTPLDEKSLSLEQTATDKDFLQILEKVLSFCE